MFFLIMCCMLLQNIHTNNLTKDATCYHLEYTCFSPKFILNSLILFGMQFQKGLAVWQLSRTLFKQASFMLELEQWFLIFYYGNHHSQDISSHSHSTVLKARGHGFVPKQSGHNTCPCRERNIYFGLLL